MKRKSRIASYMQLMSVALLMVMMVVACGSKVPTPEQVAQKIDNKETLSESDYTSMIDYCGEYAEKAQSLFDVINAQPNDSTEAAVKATSDMAALYAKYPYLDMFRTALANTDVTALGKDNEKKVNEYAKYQAFPLPGGEGADLQNPDVVGMIEQTPATDTTGVIASGDGEAVDINVK